MCNTPGSRQRSGDRLPPVGAGEVKDGPEVHLYQFCDNAHAPPAFTPSWTSQTEQRGRLSCGVSVAPGLPTLWGLSVGRDASRAPCTLEIRFPYADQQVRPAGASCPANL